MCFSITEESSGYYELNLFSLLQFLILTLALKYDTVAEIQTIQKQGSNPKY